MEMARGRLQIDRFAGRDGCRCKDGESRLRVMERLLASQIGKIPYCEGYQAQDPLTLTIR
jgi:hypothetical protein